MLVTIEQDWDATVHRVERVLNRVGITLSDANGQQQITLLLTDAEARQFAQALTTAVQQPHEPPLT